MTASARLRWQLLQLLPKVSWPLTIALGAVVLVQSLLPVAFTIATGFLVGTIPDAIGRGFSSPAGHRLIAALTGAGVVFVLMEVMVPVSTAIGETLGRRLDGHVRARAMRATLAPAGIRHLEDPTVLDKAGLARGAMDGNFTPGGAAAAVAGNASQLLQSVASAVIVATFNVPLAIALVVAWRVVRLVLLRQFLAQVSTMVEETQSMRRSTYYRDLALTPGAAKEGRVFGLAGWILDRFTQQWTEAMAEVWRTRRTGRLAIVAVIVGVAVVSMASFLVIGEAAIAGRVSLTELTILLGAVGGVGVLSISDADLQVSYGLAALPALTDLEGMVADELSRQQGQEPAAGLPSSEIRFEDVHFCYPGRTDAVLAGIDLVLPVGTSTAIVGDNGAGKTTLVKLLTRLYEPTSGRVSVDGVDLATIAPADWQRRVAAIFQDFIRYELPVSDNVAYGAADHHADEAAIANALERAGAATIVDALPGGQATVLSRRYEGGTELSGGEWQRIALARALFAVDAGAGVLVLDEPTANLDVRAEAELYDRFLELTSGLTTVVISHRFSTVRRADNIVVVEHGQVVESGSHDALVRAGGRYAAMFRLQAARFEETAQQ